MNKELFVKNTIRLFTITLALSLVACTSVEKKEFFYEVVGGAMIENEINSNQDIKKLSTWVIVISSAYRLRENVPVIIQSGFRTISRHAAV